MLSWNVYVYDCNQQKIEVRDIFAHGCFRNALKEILREHPTKEEFAEKLKSELRYYFWSRAEWEIIVKPWVGNRNPDEVKIDVYDQIMNNWHVFLDYVYSQLNLQK